MGKLSAKTTGITCIRYRQYRENNQECHKLSAWDSIGEETKTDRQQQKLFKRILKEDWEKNRNDIDISQFYSIKRGAVCHRRTCLQTTPYEPTYYIVYKTRGSTIWARRITDGHEVFRDSICFKYIDRPLCSREVKEGNRNRLKPGNRREIMLPKAKVGNK